MTKQKPEWEVRMDRIEANLDSVTERLDRVAAMQEENARQLSESRKLMHEYFVRTQSQFDAKLDSLIREPV